MALVIVLILVVLLCGLVVAFFSRALSQRQISDNSANQIRVELLARGAIDAILGDLKTEIAAGSRGITIGSGTAAKTLYLSGTSTTANRPFVPYRVGTGDGLPNLVKRSAQNQTFFPAAGDYNFANNTITDSGTSTVFYPPSNRATAVSSTASSLNGRYITPARWNKPLLMPMTSATNGTFTAPDWILVARDGSNPILSGTTVSAEVKWSNGKPTTVVGRYAYAVYDEGGLLDMNVAGYPFTAFTANPVEIARKGALAFADLTQLPLTSGSFSQGDIDKLIAWRNAATATSGFAYISAVRSNTTGFLSVTAGSGSQTDRAFISRQSLINFLGSCTLSISGSAAWPLLQYMGTFSRGLEQPSCAPPVDRPKIVPPAADEKPILAVSASVVDSNLAPMGNYRGGNDGNDGNIAGDDIINPRLLEIRAASAFPRNDGTTAKTGEPLVLKRFALNRLAWLTCKGPSGPSLANPSGRNASDADILALKNAGITDDFLQQGTDANIKKYFGLTWTTSTPASVRPDYEPPNFWTYGNGITDSDGKMYIGTLQKVRDANREPDFFELLKAAICAGSLGKAAAEEGREPYCAGFYYQLKDRQIDPQIIQIGANIIDQFDADGYPTRIVFDNSSTPSASGNPLVIRGCENLPSLYRVRIGLVQFAAPDARAAADITATINQYTAGSGTPLNPGNMVMLARPELWNPHAQTSASGNPSPTAFRLYAESAPPSDGGLINDPLLNINVKARGGSIYTDSANCYTSLTLSGGTPATGSSIFAKNYNYALSGTNSYYGCTATATGMIGGKLGTSNCYGLGSELLFDLTNASLFREPTLLQEKGLPTGTNLGVGPGNVIATTGTYSGAVHGTDLETNSVGNFIGFHLGELPMKWISYTSGTYNLIAATQAGFGVSNLTVRLQYRSDAGQWVTCSESYLRQSVNPTMMTFTSGTAAPLLRWNGFDPRSSRFGYTAVGPAQTPELFNQSERPGIPTTSGAGGANGLTGRSLPGSIFTNLTSASNLTPDLWHLIGWHLPGTSGNAPTAIRTGDFSQNVLNFGGSCQYYTDADDIVRRAAGAYAATSNADGLPMATGNNGSRPIILNRPFRSVAELGYVFKGTPWKNLDFFTPETGDAALLDVFCISEPQKPLVAGKVDLNTRQAPVLQAILAGALKNELDSAATDTISSDAATIANTVVARTTSSTNSRGPFANISELAGRLVGKGVSGAGSEAYTAPADRNGNAWTYSGLVAELTGTSGNNTIYSNTTDNKIQRRAETAVRALSDAGQTRVWNLLIDLVAQTGKYPESSTRRDQFLVQGEKRYWFHVAIDRLTGQILDSTLEPVSE